MKSFNYCVTRVKIEFFSCSFFVGNVKNVYLSGYIFVQFLAQINSISRKRLEYVRNCCGIKKNQKKEWHVDWSIHRSKWKSKKRRQLVQKGQFVSYCASIEIPEHTSTYIGSCISFCMLCALKVFCVDFLWRETWRHFAIHMTHCNANTQTYRS